MSEHQAAHYNILYISVSKDVNQRHVQQRVMCYKKYAQEYFERNYSFTESNQKENNKP